MGEHLSVPDESTEELNQHCQRVIEDLADGQVIPFLGAGVNLCDRPEGQGYKLGSYLPSGKELARELAERIKYPWPDIDNLLRVSWYVHFKQRNSGLYRHLHKIFSADYPFTSVHEFLAKLPRWLRRKGYPNSYQIIVTTNYDDVLERAFTRFGEPFDVVYYVAVAEKDQRGKFVHVSHKGVQTPIIDSNSYDQLPIDENMRVDRTIILKIHGAINRTSWARSSFVITEDDYIEYMARIDPSNPLPSMLAAKMRQSSFLFLGYSLSDWNLRVILHRILAGRPFGANSWAILDRAEEQDEKFWESRDVDFKRVQLERYMTVLREQVSHLLRNGDAIAPIK